MKILKKFLDKFPKFDLKYMAFLGKRNWEKLIETRSINLNLLLII